MKNCLLVMDNAILPGPLKTFSEATQEAYLVSFAFSKPIGVVELVPKVIVENHGDFAKTTYVHQKSA